MTVTDAERFRRNIAIPSLLLLADLGLDVMDDAWVESTAQILEENVAVPSITFIDSRRTTLSTILDSPADYFWIKSRGSFLSIPRSRLAYTTTDALLSFIAEQDSHGLEGTGICIARIGASTFDDERFRRLLWEVSPKDIGEESTWCMVAKSTEFALGYYPYDNLVKWNRGGAELAAKNYEINGSTAQARQSSASYFVPGVSFTRRSEPTIAFRVHPSGCTFASNVGVVIPARQSDILYLLGLLNSSFARAAIQTLASKNSYTVGHVKSIAWIEPAEDLKSVVQSASRRVVEIKRDLFSFDERDHHFRGLISSIADGAMSLKQRYEEISRFVMKSQDEILGQMEVIDEAIGSIYNIDSSTSDLKSYGLSRSSWLEPKNIPFSGLSDHVCAYISFLVGVTMGRWDVRFELDRTLLPKLPEIIDRLPVCQPGMLLGPDLLPASFGTIVSEEWLHARTDNRYIPSPQLIRDSDVIPNEIYPVTIAWDGILVDDPGLGEDAEAHPADIVRRVREALGVVYGEEGRGQQAEGSAEAGQALPAANRQLPTPDAIEAEACAILGVRELRDYFRKPGGFFADHLKRYSKSRRQAPIYWPLSTASGRYTVWLYYHRLNGETLYTVVNRYVEPKIAAVERALAAAEAGMGQATGGAAVRLREQADDLRAFRTELDAFRGELLRVAGLPYQPNLNDGVLLNAAPLHRLFGLRRWAKDTEAAWRKLEAGEYDWAHMAYTIWPARVREVCRRDRSIAIAHGLEALCEVPIKTAKRPSTAAATAATADLDFEGDDAES